MSEEGTQVLTRQPIFDAQQRLWGYEISCLSDFWPKGDPETALTSIASSAYIGLQEISTRGRRLLVSFREKSVLDCLPYALPSSMGVLKISEATPMTRELLALLTGLKKDGYLVAVDIVTGRDHFKQLFALADVLCLDLGRDGVTEILDGVRRDSVQFLATGVRDRSLLATGRRLGFDLFQGSFYKSPEGVQVRRLASNEVARFRLLEMIEEPDPDFARLSETIQADVALSYRLLTYLNSAAFGLRQNIKSVRQAIALLGWTKARNWLRVALLSDIAQSTGSPELVNLAAQRGRFLEGLGERFDYWGFDRDSLQMLGLFSLLDTILSIPMEQVVRYLPVEEKLKAALRREGNNEYLPLLRLAELLEDGSWEEAAQLVQRLGLEDQPVADVYHSAVAWSNQFSTVTV